jgi:hypothetical protein
MQNQNPKIKIQNAKGKSMILGVVRSTAAQRVSAGERRNAHRVFLARIAAV